MSRQKQTYEYNKIIGQIDLKIRTNEEPQNKFEGEITDGTAGKIIMYIYYEDLNQNWMCRDGTRVPRPVLDNEIKTMEELATFMAAKVQEIEARRSD